MRALLLALLPGAALAETEAACEAILRQGGDLLGLTIQAEVAAVELPTTLFGEVEGTIPWCEATGLVVSTGSAPGGHALRVERLRWRGLDPLLDGGPPGAVWAGIEGLRVAPLVDDPLRAWLLDQQGEPDAIDATLDADLAGSPVIRALRLDFPGDGAIDLSLETAGLELASLAALQGSLPRAGIARLSATVVLDGLFESYALMPLYRAVLEGSADPEADAARLSQGLAAQARALPEATFPGPTREALAAFALSLPHPRGTLRLDLRADPPLGLAQALAAGSGDPGALEGATILALWTPAP